MTIKMGLINKKINKLPLNEMSIINNNACTIKFNGISEKTSASVKLNDMFSTDSFELRNFNNFLMSMKMDNITS